MHCRLLQSGSSRQASLIFILRNTLKRVFTIVNRYTRSVFNGINAVVLQRLIIFNKVVALDTHVRL